MGDDEQLACERQMARRVCVCVRGQRCGKVVTCAVTQAALRL